MEVVLARYPHIVRAQLEGGLSGEKVPANLNILCGRGRGAAAAAAIPGDVLRRIVRCEPVDLLRLHQRYANASLWAGNMNSHASLINVLAAIYVATGQDVASVPESCMALNVIDYDAGSDLLNWEVECPSIVCATVGGGTGLPTQAECLDVLGCRRPGGADALAEIIAATALANEISFWSAICAGEWVAAHQRARTR